MSRVVRRVVAAATITVLSTITPAPAAAPVVEYLHPTGGQQGTTVAVTAGGKFERWPVQFWADHAGLKAEPAADKGKLNVTIGKDVPPGAHLVRLYDGHGPSALRLFVVGPLPEAIEAEPNDEVAKAQPVGIAAVTLNGRLEKSGDVDSYAVKLEAGQCLSAAILGRRLGAPMDPLLHLCDASGNVLAFAHDGLGLDPLLVYRAQTAGTYVVRVSAFKHPPAADVRLAGEAEDVYRVTFGITPPVRYAIPAGVRRGTKGTVTLHRWHGGEPVAREVDATGAGAADVTIALPVDGGDGSLRIHLGDGQEIVEAESGASSRSGSSGPPQVASETDAPRVAPVAVTGRIGQPGEEDVYRFAAKKGERITLSVHAAALASPMDAVLRVDDETGKSLATNDDARGAAGDALLEWAAPADGVYRAVVSDRYGNAGDEYVYRLSFRVPMPGVVATSDADEYRVAPGKTATVKLNVARTHGYAAGLVAVVTGLPAGVNATAVEVPEKGGEMALTLSAAADAKPAAGPIRVMLLGTDPAKPVVWVASANLTKEAGQELVARTDAIWLTVPPP